MESKQHTIQRRRPKNGKEVETGSNGQRKRYRKRMDAHGYNENRTTTTANIFIDTNTTLHRGPNSLRMETTIYGKLRSDLRKNQRSYCKREKAAQEGKLQRL